MKEDLIVINACGHGLYKTSNNVNGSDFANQFVQTTRNPEAVFVVNYNTTAILTGGSALSVLTTKVVTAMQQV